MSLIDCDEEIYKALLSEHQRQNTHIELIASENFVSKEVLEAQGSVLTNKYAEGYPGKRYYGGCEFVDICETLAIKRLNLIFGSKYANVQPHSGSSANMAVYKALLNSGELIMGMSLSAGGHLTHGYKVNFSGSDYTNVSYGLDESGYLDYSLIEKIAIKHKPKLIIAGASAYSRKIDFKRFREIADKVGAYLLVDMAHIAGLVAGGVHENPLPYADVVTSTTHKTLRGPRGGVILCNNPLIAKKIDSAVFPGIQGGPLMHVIAAKAVCFKEALRPDFKVYAKAVVDNMAALCSKLSSLGYTLVSGGSDNHLVLVDVLESLNISGKEAEDILGRVNITCNKNTVAKETLSPRVTSGIRLGTAAMTTRGFTKEDFSLVGALIDKALRNKDDPSLLSEVKNEVLDLMKSHPYL